MLFRLGGRGRLGLVLLVLTGCLLLAGPAFATVPCSGVPGSLNSSGNGSLIVLDAGSPGNPLTCTAANSGGLPWVLPDHRITIDGNGAVIDGEGLSRLITGNNIGQTTIRNFTFKNGSGVNGGAVYLTGSSMPTLTGNHFLANGATGNGGGLYALVTGKVTIENSSFGDATDANKNTATNGAGAYLDAPAISVNTTTFDRNSATAAGGGLSAVNTTGAGVTVGLTSNTFQRNVAKTSGGAAWLEVAAGFGVVVDNTVRDNHIVPSASSKLARGAGFAMQGMSSVIQTVFMTNNRFTENAVDNTGDPTEFSANGGGLWMSGLSASSTNDLFTNNDLAAPGSGGNDSARGAGIAFENCTDGAVVELDDDVIAGNSTPAGAEGAGIDASCSGGALQLNLLNSTISGNTAGGGIAGLAGGSDDVLSAANSVITGNSGGESDMSWAGSKSVAYSLVCDPANPGQPLAGGGNICVTPLFLDATGGDVRQLIGSPTIDAGDNSLVPFGLTTDFEGDNRIAATRTPTAQVDMGADERGPISCPFLQPDLNDAPTGSIITLREGEVCIGNFTLPNRRLTLNAIGTGATIDGDHTGPAFAGFDVGATTLDNLTIRNGTTSGDGGGISVTGQSMPILKNLEFLANSAAGAGGGVSVDGPATGAITLENVVFGDGTAGNRNTAAEGGGIAVTSGGANVSLSGVQFLGNLAQTRGGGASIRLSGNGSLDVSGSTFSGNSLAPGSASEALGGGLAASGSGGGGASLTSNVFSGNSIGSSSGADFSPSGGGAWISGIGITTNSDRFTGNAVPAPTGSAAAHGGGFAIECGASGESAVLQNEVAAGNSGQGVKGSGISFNCAGAGTLSLRSSTVAGNAATSDTGGVWGSGSAGLLVVNSIVADNASAQLTGFATRNVTFSDICSGGSPHAGTANLCAPPLLVNAGAGDIHEPVQGPTVDKGSNAANIGLLTDFEGNLRLTDGDKDGVPTIDMGADETPTQSKPFLTPEEEAALAAQQAANNQVVLGARTPTKTPAKVKVLRLVKVKQKKGVLKLYFRTTKAGTLEALTSFKKAKKKKRTSKAARALKPAKGQQVYGRAKKKLKKKGSFVLTVKPAKKARAALKAKQKSPKVKTVRLRVRIVGRLTPPKGKGKAVSVKKTYTIKIKKPRKKK